jgi:hypothetical protein
VRPSGVNQFRSAEAPSQTVNGHACCAQNQNF